MTGSRPVMMSGETCMTFQLRQATSADLPFARELACQNMLRYYIHYDLLWQDEAFDVAWAGRDNWLIVRDDQSVGFFSLSRDARALYIRELQVAERFQRQGAGAWAIDQVMAMARQERRPALRLTVFKNNPAQQLYLRKGLQVQGEDECFLRMQLDFSTVVL
jgi:ribosomal protein S18 acetylase RimI-like enzyme